MKTQFFKVLTIMLLIIPVTTFAQSDMDKLYKKYAGKEGFTSMNISPEMFSLLGSFDTHDSTKDAKEAQNVMQQLEGLKMLVFESEEGGSISDFYKEIKKTLPFDEYSELMAINDSDSDIKFLIKKAGKDRISELIMIVKSDDEVLLMSMTGNLDMNTISDISHSLDMKGMENLDKIHH